MLQRRGRPACLPRIDKTRLPGPGQTRRSAPTLWLRYLFNDHKAELRTASVRSDQVVVDGVQIVVHRRDRFDVYSVFDHYAVQQLVERVGVARLDEQPLPVLMQRGLDHAIRSEDARVELLGPVAADQDLHRVLFQLLFAYAQHSAFGQDVAVVDQHHAVRHLVHLVQDVTRHNQVQAFLRELAEKPDRFGAGHRVKPVQRLVQNHRRGLVRDRLGQPDALSHALAVSGDLAVGGLNQIDALDRAPGHLFGLLARQAVNRQKRFDEVVAGHPFRERIELAAIADLAKQLLRVRRRNAENADAASRRLDQAGHQIHQRRLAGTVRADQAGDARRDGQVDAVDAEDFAVKFRDVLEDDQLVIAEIPFIHHDTTP